MDTGRLPADRLWLLDEMAEPPHFTLENAPEDNEAETPEEAAAVAEAWREHKDGKSLRASTVIEGSERPADHDQRWAGGSIG